MEESSSEWIGVSDMMTGLMMVFMFVAVLFIQQVQAEKDQISKIAMTYKDYRQELYLALAEEFREDLVEWNAEILNDSTVRFNEPNVLFDQGKSEIKPEFAVILDDFFPRYVGVLSSDKFHDYIEELRIEGHTSSTWTGSRSLEERYLKNAKLSQERSFEILQYCFALPEITIHQKWLTKVLRANGLAFANPIYSSGYEDYARSRRVEFKVKTRAEDKIAEIIQTLDQ